MCVQLVVLPVGASANTFNANAGSLGAIPDGSVLGPAAYGTARSVTFDVSGFATGTPNRVGVTIDATHPFVGDLDIVLVAPQQPAGRRCSAEPVRRAAETSAASSDLDGTYGFFDNAATSPTWWGAAATAASSAIPTGYYRASTPGPGGGADNPLAAALNGVPNMNGTWTLKVRDGCRRATSGRSRGGEPRPGRLGGGDARLPGRDPRRRLASPGELRGRSQLNVAFSMSGLTATAPVDVATSMTFSPNHTYVGDLDVALIAPNSTQATIFSRTGATTAGSFGDDSNLAGPYRFFDNNSNSWWTAAGAVGDTSAMDTRQLRGSSAGGAGGTGANTQITPTFSGVTNPNGTWILRFRDGGGGDTGSVSAASLTLLEGADRRRRRRPRP